MTADIHPLAGIIAAAARLISGVRARWLDSQPDPRQRVYFANHTSHLDFVVLWSCLPRGVRAVTRPVAAQDYWEKGLRRALAIHVFHAVLVARRNAASASADGVAAARSTIDHVLEAMGDVYSLIIFPEGTRGTGEEVGPFKSGLFHLCQRRPRLPLVPVYINNLNRILPKGEFLPVPVASEITFGPAIALAPDETKTDFLTRARDAVCRLKSA